jgi:hypothetical protein
MVRMKDLHAKLEQLVAEAQDCDLISNLATDQARQATFRRMAEQFRKMAEELRADIAARMSGPENGGPIAPV